MNADEPQAEIAFPTETSSADELRRARERESLLESVMSGNATNVLHRVAVLLNRFPETRDSDLKLQLRYWETFEGYTGGSIEPHELFERARLTSLARARARIQNQHQLFVASDVVRRRRGKLSEEEYQRALESTERMPGCTVIVDESGKSGGSHLIVGAIWFSDPEEFFSLTRKLGQWRGSRDFRKELHFKELNDEVEPMYREALNLLLREGASVSFKVATVPREGVKRIDEALEELTYQLLWKGLQHEHDTGRAPLPRALQLWKDLESHGADRLMLARLRDRLRTAGKLEVDGKVTAADFEAVDSRTSDLVQLADLLAGSLNRVLNFGGGDQVKDRFARYLLGAVGMKHFSAGALRAPSDFAMHFQL